VPRSEEIRYYAELIASLTVSAVRARRSEDLAEIRDALSEAYTDIWSLLSHDALAQRPGGLEAALLEAAVARGRAALDARYSELGGPREVDGLAPDALQERADATGRASSGARPLVRGRAS
jgi:hypothetical protein